MTGYSETITLMHEKVALSVTSAWPFGRGDESASGKCGVRRDFDTCQLWLRRMTLRLAKPGAIDCTLAGAFLNFPSGFIYVRASRARCLRSTQPQPYRRESCRCSFFNCAATFFFSVLTEKSSRNQLQQFHRAVPNRPGQPLDVSIRQSQLVSSPLNHKLSDVWQLLKPHHVRF